MIGDRQWQLEEMANLKQSLRQFVRELSSGENPAHIRDPHPPHLRSLPDRGRSFAPSVYVNGFTGKLSGAFPWR